MLQPPGTYGDPYAEAATFQQCLSEGDASYCSFHSSGTKFFVYDDGRTPGHVFSTLRELWPGAPITVEGDLEAIYDRTADVVLRSAIPRPWTEADTLLERMQGTWYAVDDPAERFNILGAERESSYDDAYISLEYLSVRDQCDDFAGAGPYLYARDEETGDDFCYVIDSVGDYRMTLMYLPDGHFLEYRNLD
ncbi:hypothetical protein TRIHO_42100 [Tritonibacter horizontis]|uniref:Uncharacterized protein n=1 Tax=Tritonibacter horizontis TaxID=1768241 RepID=A0A132BRC9_9RHOB|nr:hypothetical protein TRIHO_42100 [Tritonibacter horizontis]